MEMPTLVARGLPGHGPGLEAEQRQSVAFGGDSTASQRHVDLSVSLARDSSPAHAVSTGSLLFSDGRGRAVSGVAAMSEEADAGATSLSLLDDCLTGLYTSHVSCSRASRRERRDAREQLTWDV